MLTDTMQLILKKAYHVFSTYSPPEKFDVCTVCCMSIEEEKMLRTLPLVNLSRALICSYHNSAKSDQINKNEVAYLLPRILELIALNEEIAISIEFSMLGCSTAIPYNLWSEQEKEVINAFALQYLIDQFKRLEYKQEIVFIEDILVMFGLVYIPLDPLLHYMTLTDNFYVIASIAYFIENSNDSAKYITTPFADDRLEIDRQVTQWLYENAVLLKGRAEHAILAPKEIAMTITMGFGQVQDYVERGLSYLANQLIRT